MKPLTTIRAEIAASSVPFTLITSPGHRYVSVYLDAAARPGRFASVNAGNSAAFFVGGGGLNAAFAAVIDSPNSYLNLQTDLYNSATSTIAFSANYPAQQPIRFALVQRPSTNQSFHQFEGTVFVDIFQPAKTPAGNPDNYGMIYVCPPNGANYTTPAAFLTAVEATAFNLIGAVRYYNEQALSTAPGLATIEIIRVFLFSSSIYRQPSTTVPQVAQAVASGLLDGLAQGPTGLASIQLPNASGEYAAVSPGQ